MTNLLVHRNANFREYPNILPKDQRRQHVSIGDIHGNALKLAFVLIEEGFLTLNEDNYLKLLGIYLKKVDQLTSEDLNEFENIVYSGIIVQGATVDASRSLTLIGDELADRGNNDYFTLLILKKLHESKIDVDIMISNHSAEFLRDYEKNKFTGQYRLGAGQGKSLQNMQKLIKKGLIKEDEVRKIVQTTYQPMVKGIGYTISEDGSLSIFSHAPIGFETIEALAKKFKISYQEDSPEALIITINAINDKIQAYFSESKLAKLIDAEGHSNPNSPLSPTKPLMRLVWNRKLGNELRTEPFKKKYQVNFVHGHIGDGQTEQNGQRLQSHQNLDTSFGKFDFCFNTGYCPRFQSGVEHLSRQSDGFTSKQLYAMSTENVPENLKAIALLAKVHEKGCELIQNKGAVKLIQNRFQNVSILNRINQTLNTFNPEESGALRQRYISLYTNLVEADSRHSNKTTTDIKYEKELDTIREAVLLLQKDVQKIQFNKAMLFLENKSHLFQTKDPNSAAAKKCKAMVEALAQHARDYYKPNGTDLRQFVTQCKNTISEATSELQNHRGFWYSKVPGAIRKLLGVLSSPVFALSYSVGLCSWQSYKKTFFETPNTDSIIKISKFKESLQKITGESLEVDEENRDNIGLSGVGA